MSRPVPEHGTARARATAKAVLPRLRRVYTAADGYFVDVYCDYKSIVLHAEREGNPDALQIYTGDGGTVFSIVREFSGDIDRTFDREEERA